MADNKNKLSEEEKDQLRSAVNAHISQYCNYAALVIILISLASFVLGQFDAFFLQALPRALRDNPSRNLRCYANRRRAKNKLTDRRHLQP